MVWKHTAVGDTSTIVFWVSSFLRTWYTLTSGKREDRGLLIATFDGNRRAVEMLNPMREKNEGTYRGGEGAAPVSTARPEDR